MSTFITYWTSSSGDNGTVTYHYPALKISSGTAPAQFAPRANGEQNYPNPLTSNGGFKTTIPFETSGQGTALIRIVDQTGKEILKDNMDVTFTGKHFFYFTGSELPAGTYYYQIEFPFGVIIVNRTMLIIK
ncbi:MAG: T9SS type A sorting domain-containing protein [Bacteroidota bacterium]|nr:T9SS type A sorting domain-containing protein [Bacteroidota bacterium]MDP4234796.1 T9SS type A sorting domain-containing protein [Bacteroidota bacterium]MDP4244108.1 T9SS type A sorting domain-containing protein [Bacteroidota bacterium]MDP4289397.1 T9SS type A sorting domain-containing protein [Bacteroidota bacterium]